ncbi:MAG TPA: hypothetical protein ENH10_06550 [Bacteroidetes bacterium]|nr:hypothetical protein BMS3Bbin04_00840 [bacterium BMS3Bbin04]HDO65677.1 hypothetical protein [Bacteroidota bacterium]HEX04802.1 hypothetical protein [Bacteroidota bacterium]
MKYGTLALLGILIVLATVPAFAVESESELSLVFMRSEVPALDNDMDLDAWNDATMFGSSYSQFDLNRRLAVGLQEDPEDGEVETVTADDTDDTMMMAEDHKNPGRALLLSAIMPGAGELYAGKKWRAAGFFALEMSSWVAAIYYAQQGEDKNNEYEKFAEKNYSENYYRAVEYAAAQDATVKEGFTDPEADWVDLEWQDKLQYLPNNFTHDLPDEHNQQYYENIGKYLTQFGYGWLDYARDLITGYDALTEEERTALIVIGAQEMSTPYQWAGESPMVRRYIVMRDDSNNLLDLSADFFAVIMVNHVASALHAGFTVRAMNKKAEIEPQVGQIWHNDELVATAGFRIRF